MAYLRYYQAAGDPFLGGIFKGIGKVAGFVGKAAGILPGGSSKAAIKEAVEAGLKKIPKGAAAAGAAGFLGGALIGRGRRSAEVGGRRYRRMNPGNVRALRRSMRRVQSFAKLATQTISFTKRVRMKKKRRG